MNTAAARPRPATPIPGGACSRVTRIDLGYFSEEHRKQGGYANGGLMPWVGGELCLGAFQCGREAYGVELLRQYADHLRRTGGAQVWYWPDGEPGFRTTNEVNYAGWGMAQWTAPSSKGWPACAIFPLPGAVQVSPRWAAAGVKQAHVSVAYPVTGACFCYSLQSDDATRRITLEFTGSGEQAVFHVLLPEGWQGASVQVDGTDCSFQAAIEDQSRYVDFSARAWHGRGRQGSRRLPARLRHNIITGLGTT